MVSRWSRPAERLGAGWRLHDNQQPVMISSVNIRPGNIHIFYYIKYTYNSHCSRNHSLRIYKRKFQTSRHRPIQMSLLVTIENLGSPERLAGLLALRLSGWSCAGAAVAAGRGVPGGEGTVPDVMGQCAVTLHGAPRCRGAVAA